MVANPVSSPVGMVSLLRTVRGEELCLLRHVAPHAATIQIYSTLRPGETVRLDLADGTALSATVASRHDSIATLDIHAGALTSGRGSATLPPRLPRLDVGIAVQLRIAGQQSPATLCNISQGGAKILAPGLAVGLKIGLLVGGLPPLIGRVRWVRDGTAGMSFYEPVPLDILAPWSVALGARVDEEGKVLPGGA